MITYNTIEKYGEIEIVIEKSRFIGYGKPVETREEAEGFLSEIRLLNKGATHNVPAFVIGEKQAIQWASDDGEPQGTAGAPIVQMIVKEDLTNIAIMVTRYFGGIKLGTGGLVRAYTKTAKMAIEAGNPCIVKEQLLLQYEIEYESYNKLQSFQDQGLFLINKSDYTDRVTVEIAVDFDKKEEIIQLIANLTAGKGIKLGEGSRFVKTPLMEVL